MIEINALKTEWEVRRQSWISTVSDLTSETTMFHWLPSFNSKYFCVFTLPLQPYTVHGHRKDAVDQIPTLVRHCSYSDGLGAK
jgi:hypothetical protein